jgi:hypothetical protein
MTRSIPGSRRRQARDGSSSGEHSAKPTMRDHDVGNNDGPCAMVVVSV